jgi:hypothetical protein
MGDRLGILYEHPEWFELLFAELDRRGIGFDKIPAERLLFDPEAPVPFRLVINRMSPSAWKRDHGNAIFAVRDYLAHLEDRGIGVINGSYAYSIEISKTRQLDLFRRACVSYPRARVIDHPSRAAEAATSLTFPVVVKPNIGGSGAGIIRFDSIDQLRAGRRSHGAGAGIPAGARKFHRTRRSARRPLPVCDSNLSRLHEF